MTSNKYFRVIYVPHHRYDKEWVVVQSTSTKVLLENFRGGSIINVEEVTEQDYLDSL